MCVKEVEGTQGQESPYRQEKACGGDGGGSRLLSDSCLLNTHKHTHSLFLSHTALQGIGCRSHRPASRRDVASESLDVDVRACARS